MARKSTKKTSVPCYHAQQAQLKRTTGKVGLTEQQVGVQNYGAKYLNKFDSINSDLLDMIALVGEDALHSLIPILSAKLSKAKGFRNQRKITKARETIIAEHMGEGIKALIQREHAKMKQNRKAA